MLNRLKIHELMTPGFILAIIMLLGTALRLIDLGTESYWIDEMSTVVEGQQSIQQLLASGRLDQPPAYYIPFHYWLQVFGTSEVSTRMFSVLTGIGSILLIFLIGRKLFNSSIGLFSAFFMAVSEFQLFYSQAARFYSFFEFMTLVSFLPFIQALRTRKTIYYILYIIASIILIFGHTYGIFVIAAQNIVYFFYSIKNRKAIIAWLISQVMIGLALLPYLLPLLFGTGGVKAAVDLNIYGYPPPSLIDVVRFIYYLVMYHRGERSWEIIIVYYALALAFLVGGTFVYAIRKGRTKFSDAFKGWGANWQDMPDIKSSIFLTACWLICPILLPFMASFLVGPMFADHYIISAAPALYLLMSLAIYSVRKITPSILFVGALAILVAPSLIYYYHTNTHEEWRNVASYVGNKSNQGDVIIFAPNMGIGIQQKSFNWYYRGSLPECGLGTGLKEPDAITDAIKQCAPGGNRLWVIIPNFDNVPAYDQFRDFFLDPNLKLLSLVSQQRFVGISVYLFDQVN